MLGNIRSTFFDENSDCLESLYCVRGAHVFKALRLELAIDAKLDK
jgi:hypothetical protein